MNEKRFIKNRDELLSHGSRELREAVVEIAEAGIRGSDPGIGTHRILRLKGNLLQVQDRTFDLCKVRRIFVVGAGKGAFPIAEALEEILGDRITGGAVVVKKGESRRLHRIRIIEGGHPIPDENSLEGARIISEFADQAESDDIVFIAVTGGASALAAFPPDGITLDDIKCVNEQLLKSGAPIRHMNAVRKHLCRLKGGRLVSRIHPAEALTLTLNTRPKGMPWPDVSLPDPSTFQDALDVIHLYDLENRLPASVVRYLQEGVGCPALETLKTLEGIRSQIFHVGDPCGSIDAAAQKAADLGYAPHILGVLIEGESIPVGVCMAGMVNEVLLRNRPFTSPCALISGGETTVTITGSCGIGGPNQEFLLSHMLELESTDRVVCLALDTDGTDGPTEVAGGIGDGEMIQRASELGIDIFAHLKNHDTASALIGLQDAIYTGHTGTNMKNLRIILIS